MNKELVRMKLADLVPYENNPRHNEAAVDATIASMQQCGNIDPIEVDENNVILSGHTRRLALLKMGYEESDVIRVTGLNEHQKKKYRLLANKTNEFAGWDFNKLEEELDGLDFEGFDFGFDLPGGADEDDKTNTGSGGGSDFNYQEQYGVIVMCENESDQERIYNDLTDQGYTCKVVAT